MRDTRSIREPAQNGDAAAVAQLDALKDQLEEAVTFVNQVLGQRSALEFENHRLRRRVTKLEAMVAEVQAAKKEAPAEA